ncbi:hypothetical protein Tco_0003070 [Tanacetum coccineum]
MENTTSNEGADRLLAERLQKREQEELTDEENAKLFMEFMERRRKHFAALRAQEKRNRPPTKAQKRNQMSVYLKHMGGYKHNQLMGRSYDEIQKMFNKEMKRSKKQKIDENEEVEEDNEAKLKMHMVIVKDDDIAVDAIPLATKPPRYYSMIRMLHGIDREDLETLWKLVKTKHGDTRPEDEHERVLWGDLKVMFEPDIKSDVWRNLQGYKVTIWKLYDSCGVHFVRFGNVHIFMLVEKRYPLTPITITNMLNKKLQADYWNEMCYQLLKLMIHMMNNKFRGGLLGLKDFKMILRVTAAQMLRYNSMELVLQPFEFPRFHLQASDTILKKTSIQRTYSFIMAMNGTSTLQQESTTMEDDVDISALTMEQYIALILDDIKPGIVNPKIGTDDEDAYEHVCTVLEILDLFHFPNVTHDAIMLRKLEEIRNFKQERDETLYHAWERYNDLLYQFPLHDMNCQQKVHIFYTGLDISTRKILNSNEFIPLMTPTQALESIQVMADHSHDWYNETTTRERINDFLDNFDAIYESFKGEHLTKEYPLKKEDEEI